VIENYKKIVVNNDELPVYTLNDVFTSIKALGYSISDMSVSETEVESEDDYKNIIIAFNVSGLPVLNSLDTGELSISVGTGIVNIHATESTVEGCYYVVDIVTSDSVVDGNPRQFKSMVIEMILQMLLKTLIKVKQLDESSESELN
jgi:hypothetical protein